MKKLRPIRLTEKTWRELQKNKRESGVEWEMYFMLNLGLIDEPTYKTVDKS